MSRRESGIVIPLRSGGAAPVKSHGWRLLSSLALALALPATAQPSQKPDAWRIDRDAFAAELQKLAGAEASQKTAGLSDAMDELLKQPRPSFKTLVYPPDATFGQLSFVVVLPPSDLRGLPVGVCLQANRPDPSGGESPHTNLGTLQLHPSGQISKLPWAGPKTGGVVDGRSQQACAHYRRSFLEQSNLRGLYLPRPPLPVGRSFSREEWAKLSPAQIDALMREQERTDDQRRAYARDCLQRLRAYLRDDVRYGATPAERRVVSQRVERVAYDVMISGDRIDARIRAGDYLHHEDDDTVRLRSLLETEAAVEMARLLAQTA